MHTAVTDGVPIFVCTVLRCDDDFHAMRKAAAEQQPAKEKPIGGWYGLKKGFRGRFGVYLPPLMEALGLCELEHNPKNNRMRAK